MSLFLTAVDHIHVYVPDMALAQGWYQNTLGFTPVEKLRHWYDEGGPMTVSNGGVTLALFERSDKGQGAHHRLSGHRSRFYSGNGASATAEGSLHGDGSPADLVTVPERSLGQSLGDHYLGLSGGSSSAGHAAGLRLGEISADDRDATAPILPAFRLREVPSPTMDWHLNAASLFIPDRGGVYRSRHHKTFLNANIGSFTKGRHFRCDHALEMSKRLFFQ
ncbi:hypothetical protein GIX45_14790 [Erwinia sp. CPCC 100877]|nr:hypothetical protein [Erwinia sp. CPCC 100877]